MGKDKININVFRKDESRLQNYKDKLKKQRKHSQSMADALEHVLNLAESKVNSSKPITTLDIDLTEKCPCAYRYEFQGFLFCGKDAPQRHKLFTVKTCEHCKHRLSQAIFLQKQTELQGKKIQSLQQELNKKLGIDKKALFFINCRYEEREDTTLGYQIKSDDCPNERMRDWHSIDLCDPRCPFFKKVKKEKIRA